MSVRRCPNCNQLLPEDSTICSMCAETIPLTSQDWQKHVVAARHPDVLNIRYRPLSESTHKGWVRGARTPISTLTAEGEPSAFAESISLTHSQRLFRPPWKHPDDPDNYHFPPKVFFWLSSIVLLTLVAGGVFGLAITMGRSPTNGAGGPTLQITPQKVTHGAFINLRGSNFSPNAFIGLTRDINIPLADTSNKSIIQTDARGNFSDTAIIDGTWSTGTHNIQAEDALLHKIATFRLLVNGHGLLQRPPHLAISANRLNFGAGDPATNSTQIVILSNNGGGLISWQGTSDRPWLQFSPQKGSFSPDNNPDVGVVIAADRSNLTPGDYSAHLNFLSNAGKASITVKMSVTPFKSGHGPILEVSPPVQSFTAMLGSQPPPTQALQINNPGTASLQWQLSSATDDGAAWLMTSSQSGNIAPGGVQQIQVGINQKKLAPGMYKGRLTITTPGAGLLQDASQTIYINLTVQAACSLQTSPAALTFNTGNSQPDTANATLNITSTPGCKAPIHWSASTSTASGGAWLSAGSQSGATPGQLNVNVNDAGLASGNYTGSISLSASNNNALTLPVTMVVTKPAPPPPPVFSFGPGALTFSGSVGSGGPTPQTAILTNTGGSSLKWHATPSATWLQLDNNDGALNAQQSTRINVAINTSGLASGDYTGSIKLNASDTSGNGLTGGQITITLHLQPPCTFGVSGGPLNFSGSVGNADPSTQSASLSISGGCGHPITWSATKNSAWLTLNPASGTLSLGQTGSVSVSVSLAALVANNYSDQISLSAVDSVTGKLIGTATIAVTLQLQPPAAIQTPTSVTPTVTAATSLLSQPEENALPGPAAPRA